MEISLSAKIDFIKANLKQPVVLVGLMGAGKTSIGQKLADKLGYQFVDSDAEIEKVQNRKIGDIFAREGEPYFREQECKMFGRLMEDKAPHVIGTGGGAFMNDQTRDVILENGLSIFLKADLDILQKRVGDDPARPLAKKLPELIEARYPTYARANLTVESRYESEDETLNRVINALYTHLQPL